METYTIYSMKKLLQIFSCPKQISLKLRNCLKFEMMPESKKLPLPKRVVF
jgi:hypothetical protein